MITTRFLSAGPTLRLELPRGLDHPSEAQSSFTFDGDTESFSILYFSEDREDLSEQMPIWIDEFASVRHEVRPFDGRDGLQWGVRWCLEQGVLWTSVPKRAGWDAVRAVTTSLKLLQAPGLPPAVVPMGQLRRVATHSRQERLLFVEASGQTGNGISVSLVRPWPFNRIFEGPHLSVSRPVAMDAESLGVGVLVTGNRATDQLAAISDQVRESIGIAQ